MTDHGGMSFGEFIRACRLAAGHTQDSLASASGVSLRTISYLETGRVRRARQGTLEALAAVLGITADARATLFRYGDAESFAGRPGRPPNQLPPITSNSVGRADDLATAVAALSNGGTIVVCGMPGVGKTTFAVQAATEVRAQFPDGQLYVDLHGFDERALDPEQTLGYLLRALLGADAVLPAAVEEQSGMFRSALAGRRVLILLDNARHEAQVRSLLPGGQTCAVIVTSRNILAGLDVARRFNLGVLGSSHAAELLAQLAGPDRLLADPDGTAELLRWCGGLPLAVRIVAARLAARPAWLVADFARRLADENRRLGEFAVGDLAVKAAFDLSYRMLAEPEKELFGWLGLLPVNSFDAAVAGVLVGHPADDAERLLESLTHANLLQQDGLRDRYRMHDLIRLYAAGQAGAGTAAADRALDRVFDWYLATVDAATRLVLPAFTTLPRTFTTPLAAAGFGSAEEAMAWLETECGNIVAAVLWAARSGRAAAAWQLADALRGFFYMRRYMSDWLATSRSGLAAARAAGDRTAQAGMLASLGMARTGLGQYGLARAHYQQALALAQDWPRGRAAILGNLGIVYYLRGQLDEAERHYALSLQINRELGNRHGEGIRLGNLAGIYHTVGEFEQALRYYGEALAIYRDLGNPHGEALTLCNFADTHRDMGRPQQAIELASVAMTMSVQLKSKVAEAVAAKCLAAAYRDLGRRDEALDMAQQALSCGRAIGDAALEVDSLNVLASIERDSGDGATAAIHHADALSQARQAGLRDGEIDALIGLARTVYAAGQPRNALKYAQHAESLATANRHGLMGREAQAFLDQLASETTPHGPARNRAADDRMLQAPA
jgi:tetratricopeptide (TPR) repeat protein/transcriptional regulator with XRE-family HTH domain